ncbi:DUF5329 domain-containing protein [Lysobacter capsici]|uniref:DUF5329 domain-containing protein n=1 Tax=Lysobacter capsici TaxID=435897 RepID=UPI00287BC1B4|nr:DUF5329 domain-containing protein [Lysobacter capsici]WND82788.1 DUF5329 domain-containing protein [Lysobacter capsici]WND87986.1 DUF5329 domain-containing protein [Lysobacter capsici]
MQRTCENRFMNHRAAAFRPRRLVVFAAALLGAASVAVQAALSPQAERETEQLIQALGSSSCQFERNGSWYDSAEAQAHLRKKLAYLRKRDMADTAELFIERAGSESSLSGKPYRVRCGNAAPVASAAWLKAKLVQLRAAKPATTPSP